MTPMRAAIHVSIIVLGGLLLTARLWAQDASPAPNAGAGEVFGLTVGQWVMLLSNVGFGGVFLYFLLQSMKERASMDELLARYDVTQKAHLQAFSDISAAYRELLNETQKTMILNVQVQTRLVEKLERMERDWEKGS